MNGAETKPAKAKRRSWILLSAILLAVLSLVFLGLRLLQWRQEQENTRLLTLVDREHPVEDDYNVEFILLGDGHMMDSRCVDDLEAMLAACREAGGKPEITASFRTWGAQERAWEEALAALTEQGLSTEEAERLLERKTERPGCSEHELGLAGSRISPDFTRFSPLRRLSRVDFPQPDEPRIQRNSPSRMSRLICFSASKELFLST